jgi:uncharacterized protein (TIGR00369 family)
MPPRGAPVSSSAACTGGAHPLSSAAVSTPLAARFAPLPPGRAEPWRGFDRWAADHFPRLLGLELEEVRIDYARMRLPFRAALNQPAGVVHGGALATLIDTVVVPAVGSGYAERRPMYTVCMQVQYLDPVRGEDAVAEGWIEKRGRSTVFCRVEVRTASGILAATGSLVYKVGPAPPA